MGKSYKRWKRRQKGSVAEEPKVVAVAKPAPEPKKVAEKKEPEVKATPMVKKSPLSKIRNTKPSDD